MNSFGEAVAFSLVMLLPSSVIVLLTARRITRIIARQRLAELRMKERIALIEQGTRASSS